VACGSGVMDCHSLRCSTGLLFCVAMS
jgi:hypothetical protein